MASGGPLSFLEPRNTSERLTTVPKT